MTPREYWNQYSDQNGGAVGVSKKLGIPYSTIAGVCNGSRGVGRDLAKRMADADPTLDMKVLVWIEPIATPDPGAAHGIPRANCNAT